MKIINQLQNINAWLKKKILILLIFSVSWCSALKADVVKVYHIGVGQGDATLIVAFQNNTVTGRVDTTSILIDAGNSSGKGSIVYDVINAELGATHHLNYIITSHLHSDHIGGMPMVLQKLHTAGYSVDFIFD